MSGHSFRNNQNSVQPSSSSSSQTRPSTSQTRTHSLSTSRTSRTNVRSNKDDHPQQNDNDSSHNSDGNTSTWRSVLDSIPSPSPPDRDGLEGWVRLFASIFIWFGAWGILDVLVSKFVSRRILLCIVLGLFVVIGMVLILMTQNQEEP